MNKQYKTCEIIPVEGIPWIEAGDSIGLLIVEALNQNEIKLEENDIILLWVLLGLTLYILLKGKKISLDILSEA